MTLAEPQLETLAEAFRRHGGEARDLALPLSDAQFTWRPDPRRWSVADCLAHLNDVAEAYATAFSEAVDAAVAAGTTGRGPFAMGMLGGWMVRLMEPPPRIRMRSVTAKPVLRGPVADRGTVLRVFAEHRGRLLDVLARSDGLDLGRIRIRSPFQPLLRMNLYAALCLIAAHERRHLAQARGVVGEPGFPAVTG